MEKTSLRERRMRFKRRLQRMWSVGCKLWMGSCLLLLRTLSPWRFHWASIDLANLRRFYPHHFATELPQLPLPLCMQGLPTLVPPIMVPAVHLLLALLDIAMLPWMMLEWFYVAQAAAGVELRWLHLLRPSLTLRRSVPGTERPPQGARNAARALKTLVLEPLPRSWLWKHVTLLHYSLLWCSYMLLSLWFSWRIFLMTFITPFQEHLAVREVLILVPLTLVMLRMLAVVNMKAVSKLRSYIVRAPSEMSEIRAYHATQWSNIQSIRENGLRVSTQGMLGRGVYISRDLNKVWGYGGPAGAICEVHVSVGRIRIIDRQHHPKQKLWSNEADMAYVPYRCGMVPSGLEEACVADVKRIQLVRVWDKRLLFVLLIYDIFRTILEQLRCTAIGSTWRWLCTHQARLRPKKRLWAHDLEHGAVPYCADKCWHHEPHATVPPALLKKCDRSQ